MELKHLKFQSRLTVMEFDNYLSQFYNILTLPVDEPVVENHDLLRADIYLEDKGIFLKKVLDAYRKNIKREKRMAQSESLTELNKLRKKLFKGHLSYIASCETDSDKTKCEAAVSFRRLTEQYKYFYELTNNAISSVIRKYIEAVQSEEYAEAFSKLALEERTADLQKVNEQYIALGQERENDRSRIGESPSEMRQQCVKAYRNLVMLINFALEKNKYYKYEEKASQLAALTEHMQELINRRRNAAENKETEEENTVPESNTDTTTENVA